MPPRPAPTGKTLNRRVPGATLPATVATARPAATPGALLTAYAEASPDDVRALVEQFETGVAQALQDTQPGHQNKELSA